MKRVNITIDEETIEMLDAISDAYGMRGRSEAIRFLSEILDEIGALPVLENVCSDSNDDLYYRPSARQMLKAARNCSVTRD